MARNIVIIFSLTFLYCILRYNVAGDVAISDIPTFIVNKAIAFSLIILLFLIVHSHIRSKLKIYQSYRTVFKNFTMIHVVLSLVLSFKEYYPGLFGGEKFTFAANLSILSGVIAFIYVFKKVNLINTFLLYSLIMLHLFFLGFKGWFNLDKWISYLPPISLICFLMIGYIFIYSLYKKKSFWPL